MSCKPDRDNPGIDNFALPTLSYPGCYMGAVHWLYWNSLDIFSRWWHCYVKMTSSYHVAFRRIQELLTDFFNMKTRYLMVSKKNSPLFVWGWDGKIRPLGSTFVITRQVSWCQTVILGRIFLSHPHTHDKSLKYFVFSKHTVQPLMRPRVCIQLNMLLCSFISWLTENIYYYRQAIVIYNSPTICVILSSIKGLLICVIPQKTTESRINICNIF